ncbi:MAG TPA: tetratricopeptide repeat protein [Streptosporangiaceae bacterium]|nr:tetratricopeptide repeat protein [Streptosporangiaceae bacterium]
MAELGAALRWLVRRARRTTGRKLTCRELAELMGYGHSSVGNWLGGKSLPSADRLGDLLVALGASSVEQRALATARDQIEERRRAPAGGAQPLAGLPAQPVVSAPRQLPPDVRCFTGRVGELERLDGLLGEQDEGQHAAVVITAVNGMAGVGKTALALRWAHRVAGRFEGQLYADLGGYDPAGPVEPLGVLSRFLRALGMPAERVPAELAEAAGMYRTLLDGRRVLVVLDNAESSAQVRPLLPGAPGCAVVVTSRSRLPGLGARDGAVRVTLAPLPEAEAVALLRIILGPQRADAEPAALAQIAARCAYLPLALRVAAERATARPQQSLASLAAEFGAANGRLDVLTADDDPSSSVRTVFSWSYQTLPADAARMFRLLGLHAGPDISVAAAASLAGSTRPQAQRLLETLAGAHLLEESSHGRYRFHDLLRAYAAEVAHTSDSDCAQAQRRNLLWYLHSATAARQCMKPDRLTQPGLLPPACEPLTFTSYEQALGWLDTEHDNLVAAIGQAHETGQDEACWQLAVTLWAFFSLRRYFADLVKCMHSAVASAQRSGAKVGEALTRSGLGEGYAALQRLEEALDCCEQARNLYREIGDRYGETRALNNLGCAYQEMGRYEDAERCFARSLDIAREIQDLYSECVALDNLGEVQGQLHRPARAVDFYMRSLAIARENRDLRNEGRILLNIAGAYKTLGRHPQAAECYRQALTATRHASDRHAEAETHRDLGDLLHDMGQPGTARTSWCQALAIFEELTDPQATEVRARLLPLGVTSPGGHATTAAPENPFRSHMEPFWDLPS